MTVPALTTDLAGLAELARVADRRSFTAAAAELGVTPSAVSQAISALEGRVGVRLLQRTTRKVGLTEAGARFLAHLRPALDGVDAAFASLDELRARPAGTLRLTLSRLAHRAVLEPALAAFLATYPDLRVEIAIEDGFTSIVDKGFDAGIRLGESVEKDMVSVRVTDDYRVAVVGAPAYFATHRKPKHPRDLRAHDCIRYRQITSGTLYRWELTVDGRDVAIAVDGRIVTNDADIMVRAALDGLGLAHVIEHTVADALADGRLVRVLAPYCPRFPGLHLYFPSRRQLPAKLRALVEFLQARRR